MPCTLLVLQTLLNNKISWNPKFTLHAAYIMMGMGNGSQYFSINPQKIPMFSKTWESLFKGQGFWCHCSNAQRFWCHCSKDEHGCWWVFQVSRAILMDIQNRNNWVRAVAQKWVLLESPTHRDLKRNTAKFENYWYRGSVSQSTAHGPLTWLSLLKIQIVESFFILTKSDFRVWAQKSSFSQATDKVWSSGSRPRDCSRL